MHRCNLPPRPPVHWHMIWRLDRVALGPRAAHGPRDFYPVSRRRARRPRARPGPGPAGPTRDSGRSPAAVGRSPAALGHMPVASPAAGPRPRRLVPAAGRRANYGLKSCLQIRAPPVQVQSSPSPSRAGPRQPYDSSCPDLMSHDWEEG